MRGMSGWMTACSSPWTWTSKPAAVNVSPCPTVCTRPGRAAARCSATERSVQISAPGSASLAARSRPSSKWSGCSCVTRIASAPIAAPSSLKPPGSRTSVCPSFSRRTQLWDFFVSFMVPILPQRGAGRRLAPQSVRSAARASLGGRGLLSYDLLGHLERAVRRRYAAVDGRLQQHFLDLTGGQAVAQGGADVGGELVRVAARDQGGEGHAAARAPVEAGAVPDLAPRVPGEELLEVPGDLPRPRQPLVDVRVAEHLAAPLDPGVVGVGRP